MKNGKPYRTKELKKIARQNATKNKYGYFTSDVKVYFHDGKCDAHNCICGRSVKVAIEETVE